MRWLRFSLAVKYRILFGCAVALILGAALYVPWYMLEAIVFEQPFSEARRIADDYFRLALATPSADRTAAAHSLDAGLLSLAPAEQPRFTPLALENAASSPAPSDALTARALRRFSLHPKQDSLYEIVDDASGPRFRYAHAVRASKSCLQCHGESGRSAVRYQENQLAGVITVSLGAEQSRRQLLVYRLGILAAGALAGVLAILVFYLITHRFILAPIGELRSVAGRVTEGDLSVRSAVRTGDEFQSLAESLNLMLERLRSSQEELKRANQALDQKLGELAEVNVSLYESNRVKSEFLANVSHELRTPLTSIIGFAELLRDNAAADTGGKVARYTDNILISGRILLEIINDLLDLAKIEAGRVELKLESFSISELCTTLIEFMRPIGDKKNLIIALEADADAPLIVSDRGRVRQVLYNLLSNAVKFTPEGGGVTLRCRRDGADAVRLEVADTGPGISAEHQAMIFEKFRQIDGSATREHYGTGLGLAISKELTELLGGQISVSSEMGKGATFWVRLPLAATEPHDRRLISLV